MVKQEQKTLKGADVVLEIGIVVNERKADLGEEKGEVEERSLREVV